MVDYHVKELSNVELNCSFIKTEILWSVKRAYKFAIFDPQKAKSHE